MNTQAWGCHPTPAQIAEMQAEARENSRQLVRNTVGRYPDITTEGIAKLFGWSVEIAERVIIDAALDLPEVER